MILRFGGLVARMLALTLSLAVISGTAQEMGAPVPSPAVVAAPEPADVSPTEPLDARLLGVAGDADPASEPIPAQQVMDSDIDRIDPRTGSLRLMFHDALLPGNGGFDLAAVRTYQVAAAAGVDAGWSLHYGYVVADLCNGKRRAFVLPDGTTQVIGGDMGNVSPDRWQARCVSSPEGVALYSPQGLRYEMAHRARVGGVERWYTRWISDRNGNRAEVRYVASGSPRVARVDTSDGRSITFEYGDAACASTNAIKKITASGGGTRVFEYEAASAAPTAGALLCRPAATRLPDGTAWRYTYYASGAAQGLLRSVTRPQGGRIEYGYTRSPDGAWLTTSRTLSNGAAWTYRYPALEPTISSTVVDTPTRRERYRFAQEGGLYPVLTHRFIETRAGADVQVERQDWGIVSRGPVLTRRTVRRGGQDFTTVFSDHTEFGGPRQIHETGPSGETRTTRLSYKIDLSRWVVNQVDEVSVAGGDTVSREWDDNVNLVSETRNGVKVSFTRHAGGDIASVSSARGHVTTFGAYKRGVAQSVNFPDGGTLKQAVDNAGRIVARTDAAGRTTNYDYDPLGRLVRIQYPAGNPLSVRYTARSRVATRGAWVQDTQYDSFGRVAAVTTGGITTDYDHDSLGRLTFESNPGATVGRSFAYDVLDRMTRVTHADGRTVKTTHGASSTTVVDENEHATTWVYRAYGDPDDVQLMAVQAPLRAADVKIERNVRGQILSATQGGITHGFVYDPRGYLVSSSTPETGTTLYGRDAAGNLTSLKVGASGLTQYAYDALDRLVRITYADAATPDASYAYTSTGALQSVSTSAAVRRYTRDANDNITVERLTVGELTLSASYAYDGNDALASITYPQSRRVIAYAPDALGRATRAGPYATAVSYGPSGQLAGITLANGATSAYGRDTRLRTSSLTVKLANGNSVLASRYGYDGAGNLLTVTDGVEPSANRTLGYDALDRLSTSTGPWGSGSMSYDAVGNLVRQVLGSATLAHAYDGRNRLTGVSGAQSLALAYDAHGNVTRLGAVQLQYDEASRLVCLDCARAGKVAYGYDGAGTRVRAVRGAEATVEFRDHAGRLLAEVAPGTAAPLVEHVYAAGKRIVQRTTRADASALLQYLHEDPLGSPVLATDGAGKFLWKESYKPWGARLLREAAGADNKLAFAGAYTEGGLALHGARYYHPVLGRFLGVDPLAFTPRNALHSLNRYAYANNNPYRYVDPTGFEPWGTGSVYDPPGSWSPVAGWGSASQAGAATAAVGLAGETWLGRTVGGLIHKLLAGVASATRAGGRGVWAIVAGVGIAILDQTVENAESGARGADSEDPNVYVKPPKDAYDPNGPKAPGKPPAEVGFEDPKGGENWVPNPNPGKGGNSRGWQDANGDVWVPTGQGSNAHGGPHWDVQSPGGGYRNVRPPKKP